MILKLYNTSLKNQNFYYGKNKTTRNNFINRFIYSKAINKLPLQQYNV